MFLGLYDSVASVGLSRSVAETLPVPGFWADGHHGMTPDILDCLHPEQKQAWLSGMYDWWIIARDGALQGGSDAQPVVATPNEWFGQHIGNAGVIRLAEKNEADHMLNDLHNKMSHVPKSQQSEIRPKVIQLLVQLNRQNIHDYTTRLKYVGLLLIS